MVGASSLGTWNGQYFKFGQQSYRKNSNILLK